MWLKEGKLVRGLGTGQVTDFAGPSAKWRCWAQVKKWFRISRWRHQRTQISPEPFYMYSPLRRRKISLRWLVSWFRVNQKGDCLGGLTWSLKLFKSKAFSRASCTTRSQRFNTWKEFDWHVIAFLMTEGATCQRSKDLNLTVAGNWILPRISLENDSSPEPPMRIQLGHNPYCIFVITSAGSPVQPCWTSIQSCELIKGCCLW